MSTKNLVFKERPSKKLMEKYVGPYAIEEVVSLNVVKLRLPSLMRIHPVVNVSWIVHYKEQVKGQKKEEEKPVEVEGVLRLIPPGNNEDLGKGYDDMIGCTT